MSGLFSGSGSNIYPTSCGSGKKKQKQNPPFIQSWELYPHGWPLLLCWNLIFHWIYTHFTFLYIILTRVMLFIENVNGRICEWIITGEKKLQCLITTRRWQYNKSQYPNWTLILVTGASVLVKLLSFARCGINEFQISRFARRHTRVDWHALALTD